MGVVLFFSAVTFTALTYLNPISCSVTGLLRYQVDFQLMETFDDLGEDFNLDDY